MRARGTTTAWVLDVALYILIERGHMAAMRLNKLVYYAQAWSFARHGAPLFMDEIQAWAYGPVIPELHVHHRRKFIAKEDMLRGATGNLSLWASSTVDAVLKLFGDISGAEMSYLTHREEPWLNMRRRQNAIVRPVITHEAMAKYYSVPEVCRLRWQLAIESMHSMNNWFNR